MNKKIILGATAILAASMLYSCNNNGSTTTGQTAESSSQASSAESQDHAGHDHAQAPQAPSSEPAAILPNFTFYQLRSGIRVTNENVAKDKNTVFILFDPGCSHCQHEATELEKNIDRLKDVNIYYISMNDPALVLGFFDTFAPKLSKSSNVEVLIDKDQTFIQSIHVPSQFPANYVYGADGKLKTHWEGEKNINEAISQFHK
ncbi:redoxin domain-containing protein [Sphingobacterium sp. N143]|uniref:TlpA family protein disulfide reductase n=1 Tax=Sphingobacterium sp. N143 TaxID=2746727 RepID=UPI0025753D8F|nr:redoxin domain-containing protein [Sphingobacterium sp. N143]MDM1293197.1 redoxin domain-containing protein [Sphingobacterium sp. N143]